MIENPVRRETTKSNFNLSFEDACRSSTILPKTVAPNAVQFPVSSTQDIPAFSDSIDSKGEYETGVCGEKRVSLGPDSPTFISISASEIDPVKKPFSIKYDATKARSVDVKQHKIDYVVESVQYGFIVSSITGSFDFTIFEVENCPIDQDTADTIVSILAQLPVSLTLYKGVDSSVSVSISEQLDAIIRATGYEGEQLNSCKNDLSVSLVTSMTGIELQQSQQSIRLTDQATEGDAEIIIKLSLRQWIIPVITTIFECELESISFDQPKIEFDYMLSIGNY